MYHSRVPFVSQEEFVRMYREETGRPIVELAHMELCEPSIDVAFSPVSYTHLTLPTKA